jgi:hypothetical protein
MRIHDVLVGDGGGYGFEFVRTEASREDYESIQKEDEHRGNVKVKPRREEDKPAQSDVSENVQSRFQRKA